MRFWTIAIIFLMGCGSSKDPAAVPVTADFFPLQTNTSYIYAVDSVVTDQSVKTTYSYDLKVQVTDSFPDAAGDVTYIIQRYKKPAGGLDWIYLNSWSSRLHSSDAVVTEGNISFVKISGPIAEGKNWNGNALNNLGGDELCPGSTAQTCDLYTIKDLNKPFTAGGVAYDQTLTVIESNNMDTIVFEDVRYEVYAKKLGLVFRQIIQLTYCSSSDCLGQQKVDKGLEYTQTLKSDGKI